MLLKYCLTCLLVLVAEGAKIGLGNGRPSEEPSTLKSEVLKYKTSECGGSSSSEEQHYGNNKKRNKRPGHHNKKDSDESGSNESEEGDKKKKGVNHNQNGGKNNPPKNNPRISTGKNFAERPNDQEFFRSFSTAFEGTQIKGNNNGAMSRRPQEEYYNPNPRPNNQPQGQGDPYNRWDDPNQNRYPNRNGPGPQYPNRGPGTYPMEEDFYPQGGNRRPQQDPYSPNRGGGGMPDYNNHRGGGMGTRFGERGGDRDDKYQDRDDRYNNRGERGDRDDRYSNNGNTRPGTNNRNNRNQYQNNYDDPNNDYDRRGGNGNKNNRHGGPGGNDRHGGGNIRNRNKKGQKNDGECISQCVFNNMEIMEDDGIPSEAGMIKWAQDKIKNEKLKQAAVKEIRKCFGTLASSDGENSCNFSKSLAACLKLGLDEDKE